MTVVQTCALPISRTGQPFGDCTADACGGTGHNRFASLEFDMHKIFLRLINGQPTSFSSGHLMVSCRITPDACLVAVDVRAGVWESVVWGKRVSRRVHLGGSRIMTKNNLCQ